VVLTLKRNGENEEEKRGGVRLDQKPPKEERKRYERKPTNKKEIT